MADDFDDLSFLDDIPEPTVTEDAPEETPPETPPVASGNTLICYEGDEGPHEFVHSGRGRKPKRCPEHRGRTAVATQRKNTGRQAAVKQLEEDVFKELALFGKGFSKLAPTAGLVAVKRAEKTAAALARMAQDNPKLLAALEIGTKIAPVLDLGETLAMFGLALMVDMGRIHPDAVVSILFGVSEIWHDINDDEKPQTAQEYWDRQDPNRVDGRGNRPADWKEQTERVERTGFEVSVPPRFARIT